MRRIAEAIRTRLDYLLFTVSRWYAARRSKKNDNANYPLW
jgi:hypothetical protein